MKTPIRPKPGFRKKKYSHASTDHQVQFLNGFAIFHIPQGTQGVWKIAKKSNHIEKFCCGSVRKLPYFFQKIRYFFSKNCKKYKKIVIYFFLLENYPSVPKLSYMFWKNLNFKYFCPKKIDFQFLAKFQKVGGTTVTVTLTVTVKNFSWGNVANEMT